MFVVCCARWVLRDWPISSFEQKDTAKVEVFLFEEKHMINLRRRFILEIHKLHLTNRMRDEIARAYGMQEPRQPVRKRPPLP